MAEQIAAIFGLVFVSIICLCVLWTILDYAFGDKFSPRNRLEENMKEYDKKRKC